MIIRSSYRARQRRCRNSSSRSPTTLNFYRQRTCRRRNSTSSGSFRPLTVRPDCFATAAATAGASSDELLAADAAKYSCTSADADAARHATDNGLLALRTDCTSTVAGATAPASTDELFAADAAKYSCTSADADAAKHATDNGLLTAHAGSTIPVCPVNGTNILAGP